MRTMRSLGKSRSSTWRKNAGVVKDLLKNVGAPPLGPGIQLQGAQYHDSNAEQLDVDPDMGGFPSDHGAGDDDMEAPRSDNDDNGSGGSIVNPCLDFSYVDQEAINNLRFSDPRQSLFVYNDADDDGAKNAISDIIGQASANKYADSEGNPEVQQQLSSEYFRNMTLVKLLSRIRFKDNVSDKLFALILFIGQFFWVLGYLKCLSNLSSSDSVTTKKKMSGKEIDAELGFPPCFSSTHYFEKVSQLSPHIEQASDRLRRIGTRKMVKCPKCCRFPAKLDDDLRPNQICGLRTRLNAKPCSGVISYVDRKDKTMPFFVCELISLLDQADVIFDDENIWNILDLNQVVRDQHNTSTSNPEKFVGLHPWLTQLRSELGKAVQIPDSDGNFHDLFDKVHGKYNAMLIFSIDGAQMKGNDSFLTKMVPASLAFADVTGAERYSEPFLMCAGVCNGSEKGETYNDNLNFMTQELLYSLSGQFIKKDPRPGGIEHPIRLVLPLVIMDSPARCKGCGTMGWMNECGCKNCTHKMQTETVIQDDGTQRTINSWYTPPLVAANIADYARDELKVREQADAYKNAELVGEAKKLAQESGIRWSVFQDLPYFSLIKMAPGEPMHLGEGEIPKLYERYVYSS